MASNKKLTQYLNKISKLSFRHAEKFGPIFREIFDLCEDRKYRIYRPQLEQIRDWLVVPYSFWPVDFGGMARYICDQLKAGRKLDRQFLFTLSLLRDFPAELAQEMVTVNEHQVRVGEYRQFVRSNARFEAYERQILQNPTLKMEWEQLKALFPVDEFLDHKGIVRRRMVCERNFKVHWDFTWNFVAARFQTALDSFCFRWSLYGMEKDKPLLLKLTVNVTSHGTMIMVPFYMSPDFRRDIEWKLITKLHKLNGATRQGDKLMRVQIERESEAERTYYADKYALSQGKQGEERRLYVIKAVGLSPNTDLRKIRRLSKDYEEFLESATMAATDFDPLAPMPGEDSAADAALWNLTNPFGPQLEPCSRLEQVKLATSRLTAEERCELMKWLECGK